MAPMLRRRVCAESPRSVRCRAVTVPEWRNWQTRGTQNPVRLTPRVGSTPTSGTNFAMSYEPGSSSASLGNSATWACSGVVLESPCRDIATTRLGSVGVDTLKAASLRMPWARSDSSTMAYRSKTLRVRCPMSDIAVCSGTPLLTRLRAAVRLRSCTRRPWTPARSQARRQAMWKLRIGFPLR